MTNEEEIATEIETTQNVCVKCGRGWPSTTFRGMYYKGDILLRAPNDLTCDACLNQKTEPDTKDYLRTIIIAGIKSETNVMGFSYQTHDRGALTTTTLRVHFTGGETYEYSQVPLVVCEAWLAAPSKGSYFIEQIKNSYPARRTQ